MKQFLLTCLAYTLAHPDDVFKWALYVLGLVVGSGWIKNSYLAMLYRYGVAFAMQWEKVSGKKNIILTNEQVRTIALTFIRQRLPWWAKSLDFHMIESLVFQTKSNAIPVMPAITVSTHVNGITEQRRYTAKSVGTEVAERAIQRLIAKGKKFQFPEDLWEND